MTKAIGGVTGSAGSAWSGGGFDSNLGRQAPATDIGKLNMDVTDPLGSVTGLASDLFGGISNFAPVKALGGAAAGIAGGIGDIGIPGTGIGVKQGMGVAGEVLAAPQNWIQTQAARSRIDQAQGKGPSDLGGVIGTIAAAGLTPDNILQKSVGAAQAGLSGGTTYNTEAALGSYFGAQSPLTLPPDLQAQLDQGVSAEKVANALADRNAGYTSDAGRNLGLSLLLDPMNLVSFGAGKALTTASRAGTLVADAQRLGKTAEEVNTWDRIMGTTYNTVAKSLPAAGAAQVEKIIGPITSGVQRALPDLAPIADKMTAVDGAAGGRIRDAIGRANAQMLFSTVADSMAEDLKAGAGLIGSSADRQVIAKARLGAQLLFSRKTVEETAFSKMLATRVQPLTEDATQLADETIRMLAQAGDTTEEIVRLGFTAKGTVPEWQAARHALYGAAVKRVVKLPAVRTTAEGVARRATLLAKETLTGDKATGFMARFKSALSSEGKAAVKAAKTKTTKAVDELGRPVPEIKAPTQVDQLTDIFGPATKAPETVAVAAETPADIARQILADHPEVAHDVRKVAREAGRSATWQDVYTWLKVHAPELPTELHAPITGEHPLPEGFSEVRKWLDQTGYRLGVEPELGWKVADLGKGLYEPIRPFMPLMDESIGITQRNPLGQAYDALFQGINQTRIIAEAQDRFVAGMRVAGVSRDESQTLLRSILNAAGDASTTPRALYKEFDRIFEKVLDGRYLKMKEEGFSAAWQVNHAFEGNLGTIGLTQKVTGRVKTIASDFGNWPVKIAEELYPAIKFRLNPLFWSQEVIESPVLNAMRGINPTKTGDVSKEFGGLYEVFSKNQITRSVLEAGYSVQMGGVMAMDKEFGPQSKLRALLSKASPKGGIPAFKDRQATLQAFSKTPEAFREAISRVSPDAWDMWVADAKAAGAATDDATITQRFVESRLNMASDQRALNFEISKIEAEGKIASPETETVWEAYKYALRKSSDQAYKTHFFNPSRGWLERTLNHPYLGLYPLSYMWGKVLPEFGRFLYISPFGLKAPLLGYDAMQHVQKAILVQMQDPEFAKQVKNNKGLIYFISYMLPATPENIPVNAPAPLRHFAQSLQPGGKKFAAGTEVADTIGHIGVFNAPNIINEGVVSPLMKALGQITNTMPNQTANIQQMLDNAAGLYDGNNPNER